MKHLIPALTLIALGLTSLLVVAPAEAQVELVVWHAYRGGEKAAFEKVVEAYNRSQGAVKVSSLAVPYDAYADKITAAVPRGKGPGVFIYAQDRLGGGSRPATPSPRSTSSSRRRSGTASCRPRWTR